MIMSVMITSCAYQAEPLVRDKRTLYYYNINSVAVLPFIDYANTPGATAEVTDIFTGELARFNESGVVHSAAMFDYIRAQRIEITDKNIREAALEIGKAFNVDAVIIGAVTEYNEYFPPVLGLSIEVVTVNDGQTVFATSETYDASFNFVREEIEQFCGAKKVNDSVYGNELIMQKMDLYTEFVSYEIIKKNL
jgi:TolB-like protein